MGGPHSDRTLLAAQTGLDPLVMESPLLILKYARSTFLYFKHLWVEEPKASRTTADLPNLTHAEGKLYRERTQNVHGSHVRLEQERVAFGHLRQTLENISASKADLT